jgi:hypothetical protein
MQKQEPGKSEATASLAEHAEGRQKFLASLFKPVINFAWSCFARTGYNKWCSIIFDFKTLRAPREIFSALYFCLILDKSM